MADMDYGTLKVYPGNYDDYMLASTQAQASGRRTPTARRRNSVAELQDFVRRFSANKSKARQATSRVQDDRQDQDRGLQAVVRARTRTSASRARRSCTASRSRSQHLAKTYDKPVIQQLQHHGRSGREDRDHRRQRRGQDHAAALHRRRCVEAGPAARQVGRERQRRLHAAGPDRRIRQRRDADRLDGPLDAGRRRRPGRCAACSAACCSAATR